MTKYFQVFFPDDRERGDLTLFVAKLMFLGKASTGVRIEIFTRIYICIQLIRNSYNNNKQKKINQASMD